MKSTYMLCSDEIQDTEYQVFYYDWKVIRSWINWNWYSIFILS